MSLTARPTRPRDPASSQSQPAFAMLWPKRTGFDLVFALPRRGAKSGGADGRSCFPTQPDILAEGRFAWPPLFGLISLSGHPQSIRMRYRFPGDCPAFRLASARSCWPSAMAPIPAWTKIEGVRVVIDAGLQRRSQFDPKTAAHARRLIHDAHFSLSSARVHAVPAVRTTGEPGVLLSAWGAQGASTRPLAGLYVHTPRFSKPTWLRWCWNWSFVWSGNTGTRPADLAGPAPRVPIGNRLSRDIAAVAWTPGWMPQLRSYLAQQWSQIIAGARSCMPAPGPSAIRGRERGA